MKVLKEGKLHKAKAIFIDCERCGSSLRFFLDKKDPRVGRKCYNCDSQKEWAWFICPVCNKRSLAEWRSPHFRDEVNCKMEEVILEADDLAEIDEYESIKIDEDDVLWLVRQSDVRI